ncbi:hypothetical protein HPB50_022523 [Hyalomma asiaticum]|uniref:Uncharacterized protein n=1 Tax=Hyalomma asiaticum TaxID=266040 RepID=A0ACB7S2R3_HYAAI|nr:hypothetical protein HPB50_022523 [Hyalomma asiaticum]
MYAAAGDRFSKACYATGEPRISDGDLNALIVHQGNPPARKVKCIRETGSVIVLFDGDEAPDYVRVGHILHRCFLYKKQIGVCYNYARVGHRADVYPAPTRLRRPTATNAKQDASPAERATPPAKKRVGGDIKRRSSSDKEEESAPRSAPSSRALWTSLNSCPAVQL